MSSSTLPVATDFGDTYPVPDFWPTTLSADDSLQWSTQFDRAAADPRAGRHAARPQPNNFDVLRLLAALLVVYGHQGLVTSTADLTGTFGMRTLAFFAISGFLVCGSWRSDPHARRFLVRRFLRIWPAYAVMVVVCAALAYAFARSNLHQLAALFFLNNLYFYGADWAFFSEPWGSLNLSIWIMPFEVNCYLLMALAGLLGNRALAALAAVAVALLVIKFGAGPPVAIARGEWDLTWTIYFGGFFAAGALLRLWPWLRQTPAIGASIALGCAGLLLGQRTIGLVLLIPAALVWIGQQSWPLLRSAARFGDLSLGIFLWAWPVQQVTRAWFGTGHPIWLQLAVVLPPVVGLAWLSRHLIERPALRLKPKRPEARAAEYPLGFDGPAAWRYVTGVWARAV